MHRTSRPLRILDLAILVAAAAVGLSGGFSWLHELRAELPGFAGMPIRTHDRTILAGWGLAGLLAATLGVTAIRLLPPRPRARLLLRQPGSVACLAALAATAIQAAGSALDLRTMGSYTSPLLVAAWYWPTALCSAVAASWLALAGGRGWHPGDWADRLGILVGLGWLGLPPALALAEFA